VAKTAAKRRYPLDYLNQHDIEACGKSRVLLGGFASELHQKNLLWLLQQYQSQLNYCKCIIIIATSITNTAVKTIINAGSMMISAVLK